MLGDGALHGIRRLQTSDLGVQCVHRRDGTLADERVGCPQAVYVRCDLVMESAMANKVRGQNKSGPEFALHANVDLETVRGVVIRREGVALSQSFTASRSGGIQLHGVRVSGAESVGRSQISVNQPRRSEGTQPRRETWVMTAGNP